MCNTPFSLKNSPGAFGGAGGIGIGGGGGTGGASCGFGITLYLISFSITSPTLFSAVVWFTRYLEFNYVTLFVFSHLFSFYYLYGHQQLILTYTIFHILLLNLPHL
jgi:hypothetical protein